MMRLWGAFLLFAPAVVVAQPAATPVSVQLKGRNVTAGDVALMVPKPRAVIARIASNNKVLRLTFAEQQSLLRRAFPGLAIVPRYKGDILFLAGKNVAPRGAAGSCYTIRHDVEAGAFFAPDDFAAVDCDPAQRPVRLGYDKDAGAPYARRDIPAFSYVGHINLPTAESARMGTAMTLRTISGTVTIDRDVVTLQSARAGQRIFVRTREGKVLAHRLAETVQEKASQ